MIQFVVSIILYFVIFFGLSFILNMLLRRTWLMAILYPFIIAIIVSKSKLTAYVTTPKQAISETYNTMTSLALADLVILGSGFAGTIVSGIVIKSLRKSGYQMF